MAEKITEMEDEDLKESINEIAQGASVSFVFGLAGYLLIFIFKLLAARYLGPEKYGVFELGNTLFLVFVLISSLGILTGIARFIPYYLKKKEFSLLHGYVSFVFKFPLIASIIVGSIAFLSSDFIASFFNRSSDFALFIKIISLAIPLKVLSNTARQIITSRKKIFYKSFSEAIIEKFILFCGLGLISFFNLSLLYIFITLLFSTLISLIFELFIYKKIKLPLAQNETTLHKEWILFSLPLFLSGFFNYFIKWSDNIVIGKMLAVSFLGIYAIAYSIGDVLGFFQNIFMSILNPIFSEKYALDKNDELNFLFKKVSTWAFGLAFPLFIFILIFGKDFLTLFYGNSYSSGYLPLIIISSGLMFFLATGPNESILILHKKTGFIFKVNTFVAILNIFLNIVLIKYLGIAGAALASAFSMALRSLITFVEAKKISAISVNNSAYFKFIVSAFITYALVLLTKSFIFKNGLAMLLLFGFGTTIIYFLASYLTKAITKEDIWTILSLVKKKQL
ncbi:MAG: flippase [Parcubacteria group bacterium]|jgi:O-antigen/teichoic acid export membrane protein